MRLVEQKDIPRVLEIFADAVASLAALGIDQWQSGYPNADTVRQDIEKGIGYVYVYNGGIAAYVALCFGAEPGYENVFNGNWLTTGDEYATLHRIAVGNDYKGHGIAQKVFEECEGIAREKGYASLRLDTHPGNAVMQHLMQVRGYSPCGEFRLPSGEEAGNLRLCFEKLL